MIVHIADTEKHKLTSFKRLNGDYVSESYGIFAAIFTVDNANSSVRIKGLYDALHMTTSAIGLSLLYLLSGHPARIVALGYVSARLTRLPDKSNHVDYLEVESWELRGPAAPWPGSGRITARSAVELFENHMYLEH